MKAFTIGKPFEKAMLARGLSNHINTNFSLRNRLLRIFRSLALVRLLVGIILMLMQPHESSTLLWIQAISLFEVLFLMIYLSIPGLQSLLGSAYLLIAIGWATLVPLLIQNVTLYWGSDTILASIFAQSSSISASNVLLLGSINQTILVLLVPLIVVSWAYSRSVLIMYCLAVAFFDFLTALLLMQLNLSIFFLALPIVIFRTMLYVIIGIIINQLVGIQIDQEHKLLESYKQLQDYALIREELAISHERNRIARELHDTLAHTLTASTVQLEAVSIIWDTQPQKAQDMVKQSAKIMREGLAETRRALHALRAGSLDSSNFVNAIGDLAESLMGRFPVSIKVNAKGSIAIGDTNIEHSLYRMVQEALFNAVRHAQAREIAVSIECNSSYIFISVTDDGLGFNLYEVPVEGHFGLQGMKERAQQIEAELDIRSQMAHGTTVTIKWMIKRDASHENINL